MTNFAKIATIATCIILLASTTAVFAQFETSPINYTTPTTNDLNSVCIVNSNGNDNINISSYNAWAVGDDATILHWDKNNWVETAVPDGISNDDDFYQVLFVNETNGWIVGESDDKGIILHYDGTKWSLWNDITYSVSTSQNDMHPMNGFDNGFYGIAFDKTGTVGWIVGEEGIILRFDGAKWVGVNSPTDESLQSVSMVEGNSSLAWACGDDGTLLMWSGASWTKLNTGTSLDLEAIDMADEMSGWAVGGDEDRGIILSANGTSWSQWTKISFDSMDGVGANSSSDEILADINDLNLADANHAWAVGDDGTLLSWNGSLWTETKTDTTKDLDGVFMLHVSSGPTDVIWAVGDDGTALGWTDNK
jgi:photosystem II stability/assembly factor-like uncharacterized protein